MGRYKNYREPRRRGFDDENYSPLDRDRKASLRQSPPVAMGPSASTEATVQWFNSDKGYGFVQCTDGAEAFLHIRQLEAAGYSSLPEGARLRVTIGQGQKGPQVNEVLEVNESTADASGASRTGAGSRPKLSPDGFETESDGSVKWYNSQKGFGFIAVAEGRKGRVCSCHCARTLRSKFSNRGPKSKGEIRPGCKGARDEIHPTERLDRIVGLQPENASEVCFPAHVNAAMSNQKTVIFPCCSASKGNRGHDNGR
jgi:CspA family cold shock protein